MSTTPTHDLAAEHWLMETPDEFLARSNNTAIAKQQQQDGFPPYETLTIRIMIFNEEAVLLQRQNVDGDLAVPVLQCKAEDSGANPKCAILQRIVGHRKPKGIPLRLLLNLQFMDFRLNNPPAKTDPSAPSDMAISAILTTRHHAAEDASAPFDKHAIPENSSLRWTPMTDIAKLSFVGCTSDAIVDAHKRLIAVKGRSFLDRIKGQPPHTKTIALRMIQGIILTRYIVDPTLAKRPALIGISKHSENRFLGVMLETWDEFRRAKMGEMRWNGHDELQIVGKWWDGIFYGMEEFEKWWELFYPMGRMRMGTGAGEVLD